MYHTQATVEKYNNLVRLLLKLQVQILHLKRQIRALSARYQTTTCVGLETSLAMRIDITEGMRSAYYETARHVADQLSDLHWKLSGNIVLISVDFDHEDNDRPEDDDDVDAEAELMTSRRT
ncbi:hypothetical protein DPMN_093176 [Dreissena polymorpha]|uniref:Uncharacterized protein n=1 Tax=Dreissena polymorpha TaxID=45954 RepID=A0A9D4L2U9_DREPO|nr:hypothetical protein DPMN_093176 [Dreissena polymorpha]